MKICIVSNQVKKTISGIGLHTNNLIQSLISDGHQVWVIAPENQLPSEEELANVSYHAVAVQRPWFSENQARWITLSLSFAKALDQLLLDEKIDLIHFTDARESLLCKPGVPMVGNINDTYSAEIHSLRYYKKNYGDWFIRWAYYRFVHVFEGIALRKLNAVIANSCFTQDTVMENYHIHKEKLFQCYKSINIERYRPVLTRRKDIPVHPPRILFVGTNMQRKGLPLLIESASRVLSRFPTTEFWVVGEDKVIPKMKALCQQRNVLDSFHFFGWKSQNELLDIYANSDIFVMPSLTEALGMVFVEAMASGLPVIGSCVGGIPEIINDGENGLMISPDNKEQLAQAIIALLQDKAFYDKIQKNGILTSAKFTVKNMMLKTYEIYNQVLLQK